MNGDDAVRLYLDLMKRCLVNVIHDDPPLVPVNPPQAWKRALAAAIARSGVVLARAPHPADRVRRATGSDNHPRAHTMVGVKRLDNIECCVLEILRDGIPGDLIEAGVWRGGAAVFMRAVLKAHGSMDRAVWVADSFEGLPPPDPRFPQDQGDLHHTLRWLAVSADEVRETFRRYDLLDEQVRFLEGWFKDTLPQAPIESLALMRLDSDMYSSTMDALEALYPKLSVGGFVIIDDWGPLPSCRQAVQDFRARHRVTETIRDVDGDAVYWRRDR